MEVDTEKYLVSTLFQSRSLQKKVVERLVLELAALGREYLAPWGAGYPLAGQLYGCPSIPRRVYSCSMPNQMQCSFTCSITFLQLALWLVSEQQGRKQTAITPLVPAVAELSTRHREGSGTFYLQVFGCILGPRRAPVCLGRG